MPPPLRSNPYRNTPDASADPRQIEGWALMEVAVRMKAAQRDPVDPEAVLEAVRLNRRLWTIIQASLLEPDCAVPLETRNALLRLTKFIDIHGLKIVADPQPEKLDVLISINREIAGGLLTLPAGGAQPAAAAGSAPLRAPAPPPPLPGGAAPRKLTDMSA